MIKNWTLTLYIAKRFLVAIFATLAVCSILIFMIDFVELLRQSGKFGEVPARKLAAIAFMRLPAYTEFLTPGRSASAAGSPIAFSPAASGPSSS